MSYNVKKIGNINNLNGIKRLTLFKQYETNGGAMLEGEIKGLLPQPAVIIDYLTYTENMNIILNSTSDDLVVKQTNNLLDDPCVYHIQEINNPGTNVSLYLGDNIGGTYLARDDYLRKGKSQPYFMYEEGGVFHYFSENVELFQIPATPYTGPLMIKMGVGLARTLKIGPVWGQQMETPQWTEPRSFIGMAFGTSNNTITITGINKTKYTTRRFNIIDQLNATNGILTGALDESQVRTLEGNFWLCKPCHMTVVCPTPNKRCYWIGPKVYTTSVVDVDEFIITMRESAYFLLDYVGNIYHYGVIIGMYTDPQLTFHMDASGNVSYGLDLNNLIPFSFVNTTNEFYFYWGTIGENSEFTFTNIDRIPQVFTNQYTLSVQGSSSMLSNPLTLVNNQFPITYNDFALTLNFVSGTSNFIGITDTIIPLQMEIQDFISLNKSKYYFQFLDSSGTGNMEIWNNNSLITFFSTNEFDAGSTWSIRKTGSVVAVGPTGTETSLGAYSESTMYVYWGSLDGPGTLDYIFVNTGEEVFGNNPVPDTTGGISLGQQMSNPTLYGDFCIYMPDQLQESTVLFSPLAQPTSVGDFYYYSGPSIPVGSQPFTRYFKFSGSAGISPNERFGVYISTGPYYIRTVVPNVASGMTPPGFRSDKIGIEVDTKFSKVRYFQNTEKVLPDISIPSSLLEIDLLIQVDQYGNVGVRHADHSGGIVKIGNVSGSSSIRFGVYRYYDTAGIPEFYGSVGGWIPGLPQVTGTAIIPEDGGLVRGSDMSNPLAGDFISINIPSYYDTGIFGTLEIDSSLGISSDLQTIGKSFTIVYRVTGTHCFKHIGAGFMLYLTASETIPLNLASMRTDKIGLVVDHTSFESYTFILDDIEQREYPLNDTKTSGSRYLLLQYNAETGDLGACYRTNITDNKPIKKIGNLSNLLAVGTGTLRTFVYHSANYPRSLTTVTGEVWGYIETVPVIPEILRKTVYFDGDYHSYWPSADIINPLTDIILNHTSTNPSIVTGYTFTRTFTVGKYYALFFETSNNSVEMEMFISQDVNLTNNQSFSNISLTDPSSATKTLEYHYLNAPSTTRILRVKRPALVDSLGTLRAYATNDRPDSAVLVGFGSGNYRFDGGENQFVIIGIGYDGKVYMGWGPFNSIPPYYIDLFYVNTWNYTDFNKPTTVTFSSKLANHTFTMLRTWYMNDETLWPSPYTYDPFNIGYYSIPRTLSTMPTYLVPSDIPFPSSSVTISGTTRLSGWVYNCDLTIGKMYFLEYTTTLQNICELNINIIDGNRVPDATYTNTTQTNPITMNAKYISFINANPRIGAGMKFHDSGNTTYFSSRTWSPFSIIDTNTTTGTIAVTAGKRYIMFGTDTSGNLHWGSWARTGNIRLVKEGPIPYSQLVKPTSLGLELSTGGTNVTCTLTYVNQWMCDFADLGTLTSL